MCEEEDIGVLYQTNIKGAFCECSFSHQACIKSTRILEQAKVETGIVQYIIQGGRGWVIEGVQVSTIVGVYTAGLYSVELLPGQVTEAWIPRCHDWSGNLLWRRFKM